MLLSHFFVIRIQEVNQRLIEIWKKNLVVGCTEFLESAITEMKHMEESLFHRIKGKRKYFT